MAGAARYRYVNGQGIVISALSRKIKKLRTSCEPAVNAGALVILKQAMIYTPVDTRNLIGSAGVRTGKNENGTVFAEIFYLAEYAAAVHEMDEVFAKEGYRPPVFKKPGARAHFLKDAADEKRDEALEIVKAVIKAQG
jgi:hypothetical protein